MWIFKHNTQLLFLGVVGSFFAHTQTAWTWTQLADMPIEISNNAVAEGEMAGQKHIYSFGGIDATKIYSGITDRAFRYNVATDIWDEISPLPVIQPLIASSANQVKNKIYIMGGYHVFSNGSETSSDEVIIYDPETDAYLTNGAPIPTAIDDQSQCVWRDSLIYVITGWSNSTNVVNVQIYNPSLDSWSVGTSLPNSSTYKAFGSSAQIIGDTIFFYGGASTSPNFPAQKKLRKGIIDANNPTQITWTLEDDAMNNNYRSACVTYGNNVYWIGGSTTSYNYDAIAYDGSGGVEPAYSISRYDAQTQTWHEGLGATYGVMDLRGYGQVSTTSWIVCGGIEDGQQVSKRTFLLEFDPVTGGVEENQFDYQLINRQIFTDVQFEQISLFNLQGQMVQMIDLQTLRIDDHLNGVFLLKMRVGNQMQTQKIHLN